MGFIIDIANIFYIKRIFNIHNSMRFLYLIDQNDLSSVSGRGNNIKPEAISQLKDFLKNIPNAEKYTLLVLNKTNIGTEI